MQPCVGNLGILQNISTLLSQDLDERPLLSPKAQQNETPEPTALGGLSGHFSLHGSREVS